MTFAELEKKETPTFEEVFATLREYAEDGLAISSRVVKKIIVQLGQLTETQKDELTNFARIGIRKQKTLGFVQDAREYAEVIYALS